ncbi:FGGY-family carbohydrate kinase [Opitutus sp. ER46]|uniref:FGGY-family carbohydrate kinase n=1 Tax=Opitutus sp. ER46 TaxID=2161864 RepID=UPI000D2FD32C|nr:FGGY-family carbohydrate kinase [Opitutus sp. ER46]PTX94630.1 hypothetical protein DB354_12940 [Opitutus sp. ER46]
MTLLLGIDLGTSYFKVGVFDPAGGLRGLGRVPVEKSAPHPGWAELEVGQFWTLLRTALGQALQQAQATPRDIAALSYSSQANTFVLLDRNGAALTPLVFWNDHRAEVPEAFARFGATESFQRTVGFAGVTAEAAVVKWHWYRRHKPAWWAQARRALTLSDYFTLALTGEPVGDASTAALLGMYDLRERGWWPMALAEFGVDPALLATPLAPGSASGRTSRGAERWLGLAAGVPFAVGGLDHHVAAIGSGLGVFADTSISTGTVLAALRIVAEIAPVPHCFHGPHGAGTGYYRLAFHPAGAGQLEQFQREFAPGRTIAELIAAAAALPPGSRPAAARWSASWGAEPAKAVRQLLEEIGWTHRSLIAAVAGGVPVRSIAATGGGARSAAWLAIKADLLGVPIVTLACPERACLGAAVLAAVAAGRYPTIGEAARAMVRPERTHQPDARRHAAYVASAPDRSAAPV